MPLHTKILWGENGFFRQLNFRPKTRKGEFKLRFKMLQNHQKFSTITWGFYMTSASLSYFAPPAQKYKRRVSAMKIHRWLSYIHFTTMVALPFFGKNISSIIWSLSRREESY